MDLGNWLYGKLVLYLANPDNGFNLVPNPLTNITLALGLLNHDIDKVNMREWKT
jgi:hypothetical protein